MRNKIIITIICIIALFHVVWYAGSRIYQGRAVPDSNAARAQVEQNLKGLKATVDLKGMEEAWLDANGGRLHLVIFPAGKNAPTLVFIPGTTAYALVYAQFLSEMRRNGFNVVGFDPRGHGQSSGRRGDYTINGLTDDLLAVVNYARGRFGGKVAVAGSSQGGMVAFYAAARDDSIAAAVCHNIADLNGKDNLVLSTVRPPLFLVPVSEFLMKLYGGYSIPISLYLDLTKEKFPDGTDAATMVHRDILSVSWITFRALGSLMRTDLAKPVEKIRVPVMLVHAERDNIFPQAYVEGIYKRLTCPKKYLLFPNTEHLVMTNDVDRVVPPVVAWLKEMMR
jgi:pimeloyl-ACP methyl ester carboxylesterase